MSHSNQTNGQTSSASEDLDRVREILFGAEQRRTTEEIAALKEDFDARLAALRSDVDRERKQLRDQLQEQIELLREGKLDREALAEMFGGMVTRLSASVANGATNGARQ